MQNASQKLRAIFDNDKLIVACRIAALEKIKNATRKNGTLIWGKLPSILTINPTVTTVSYTHLTLPTIYSV